jgi:hypothetical protein
MAVAEGITRLIEEGLIYIAEVSAKLRTDRGTVCRHMLKGVIGPDGKQRVYLEHVRLGGKLATSWPAVTRFLESLNPGPADSPPPAPRSATRRQRAAARADAECAAGGW